MHVSSCKLRMQTLVLNEVAESPVHVSIIAGDTIKTEIRRQGILLKDITSKTNLLLEMVVDLAKYQDRVKKREKPSAAVEAAEKLLAKSTLDDSKRLKTTDLFS